MIWDKNLERLEKYMDKQIDKQTENKMSRNDHIEVLRTMAIGRTEKETIEYAIKQIKQAKKWRRKARIEYQRGYEDGSIDTCENGGNMVEQIKDLIRECDKINAYTFSYPAWRLINKLKKIVGWQLEDYEERQTEEIKVGDEVRDKYNPYPRVVTSINEQDMADLIDARGNAHSDSVFCLKKTGRHYPQIAELLEQMRKESHEKDT